MRRFGLCILGLFEQCTFIGRPFLVDRVSGNDKWIQHGTLLADWQKTRKDNTVASSWSAVAGPDIPSLKQ